MIYEIQNGRATRIDEHNKDINISFGSVPVGFIIGFPGILEDDDWALCDGTNGTPDLREMTLVGAGTDCDLNVTQQDTLKSHSHSFNSIQTSASASQGDRYYTSNSGTSSVNTPASLSLLTFVTYSYGSSGGTVTRTKEIGVNYYIKVR